MDIKEIRQLVRLMSDNELCELNIEEGDRKIHLKRGTDEVAPAAVMPVMSHIANPGAMINPVQPPEQSPALEDPKTSEDSDLQEIKSPMVGTIYLAASPDSPDFATIGDKVDPASVVCIIEAMKVMNEIKAECRGTIAEVCVENAQPVEFGQVLFRVRK